MSSRYGFFKSLILSRNLTNRRLSFSNGYRANNNPPRRPITRKFWHEKCASWKLYMFQCNTLVCWSQTAPNGVPARPWVQPLTWCQSVSSRAISLDIKLPASCGGSLAYFRSLLVLIIPRYLISQFSLYYHVVDFAAWGGGGARHLCSHAIQNHEEGERGISECTWPSQRKSINLL